jgi:hypothetical protein
MASISSAPKLAASIADRGVTTMGEALAGALEGDWREETRDDSVGSTGAVGRVANAGDAGAGAEALGLCLGAGGGG